MITWKKVQEQLLEAFSVIEKELSNKTYMTRLRIVEIIERKYPALKDNFYLSQPNALLFLLLWLQQSGNIEMVAWVNIYSSEKYEESGHEPILYEDIPDIQSRTFFNEIAFSRGFAEGKSYNAINAEILSHTQMSVLGLINQLKEQWVTRHNVFYRRIDTPKNKKGSELPALPVTID